MQVLPHFVKYIFHYGSAKKSLQNFSNLYNSTNNMVNDNSYFDKRMQVANASANVNEMIKSSESARMLST